MSVKSGFNENIVAPLKIIAMNNCRELGSMINSEILKMHQGETDTPDEYLTHYHMEYLRTGERRAIIDESVRGTDLYIITDVVNNYSDIEPGGVRFGATPDEHFQDLKRIISACHGSPHRINIIMPYLYEGRFNNRKNMESLDCAISLIDIADMGISSFITFDAHDGRVQNALPILGIDNYPTSYQFIEAIMNGDDGLSFDKDSLLIVSPDIGGMGRVVFYSSILGVNMGMFYIRKDYSRKDHPIVAIEFLGSDIKDKDIIIVDDMIDTGISMIATARELKKRGARKVIIASTFGMFNDGFEMFDKAYNEGMINRIYTTNLTYCPKELLEKPYYKMVDMSRQIALIIESINHDASLGELVDHSALIIDLLKSKQNNL